jgi:hypothetical protein
MSIEYTVMTFTQLGDIAKIFGVWYHVTQDNCKVHQVLAPLSQQELVEIDLKNS